MRMTMRWRLPAALLVLLAAGVPAYSDTINISATTFVLRTGNPSPDLPGESGNGLLQNAKGKFYAPVILPVAGVKLCRFSMVFRDFDAGTITARLLKKIYTVGGSAFTPPLVMAKLESAGAVDAVRRATTVAILQPTVTTGRSHYFVELEITDTPLQVLGVEIIVKPTCP